MATPAGDGAAELMLPPVSYARTFWSALFTFQGRGRISLEHNEWRLRTPGGSVSVPASDVHQVLVRPGLFWSTLELQAHGELLRFSGLSHVAAKHLRGAFLLLDVPQRVSAALTSWQALVRRQRYLNHRAWSGWRESHALTRRKIAQTTVEWLPDWAATSTAEFMDIHDQLESQVTRLNRAHVDRELAACRGFFDTVEAKPLTRKQREAIVTNEDNTLVIAGAGTGKTSVVVGKVGYLVKRLRVPPAEILLLAYNRSAAKELQDRVDQRIGVELKASTFHALGLSIVGLAEGRKPDLSRLAERTDQPVAFIENLLCQMLSDAVERVPLLKHLIEYLRPYRAPEEFPNKSGYIGYLRGVDIRTMRGEQVRSFEESVIADWLFVNGIEYEYERRYEHDVASAQHRQYRPDFYLVDSGAYLEHFGISRDGSTAPWIDADKYQAGIKWKRDVHHRYGTVLVETYSYDRREGALTERLAERLAAIGVTPSPRSAEDIEHVLGRRGVFSWLAKLLATFLQHFKEGRHTLSALRESARGGEPLRRRSFLDVFERVQTGYEDALRTEQAIDFQDMIGRAAEHVASGRYRSPYRYIVVDEFQDMSRGRASLIQALTKQANDPRVTCVGDDWQSIYRFAGSDIGHMTNFSDHFGYTASVPLDRTFRFGRGLLAASARFVQQNPAQLRKDLHSQIDDDGPAIVIVEMASAPRGDKAAAQRNDIRDVRRVLERISREHTAGQRASVYLLGRYNFSAPTHDMRALCRGIPRVDAEFLTVHRSKGLQADYVVVLKATRGRYGFPSEVADDPLLGLVLAEPDALEYAEERRLFYVALTRARKRVFVLTRAAQRSQFVEELMGAGYAGLVETPTDWTQGVPCPDCGGDLTKRVNSRYQTPFWSCTNYPYCGGSARVCAVCQDGALVLDGQAYQCSKAACPGREDVCPRCHDGVLVERTNNRDHSKFWGCSLWRRDGQGCSFTRSIGGETAAARRRRR